jgi:ABC-2 type transport system permease protein
MIMMFSQATILRFRRLYAFCLRHLYPLQRDFDLLSDMLYWPIIDVLVWGITSQWLGGGGNGASLMGTILTGLILWNIIWRSQSEVSRNLIDEIWNNNLVNLFSTPLSLGEWVVGVLFLSLLKMTFTVTMISTIIFLLYKVSIFTLGWWLIPFFIGAAISGWWIGFVAAGIVIRWGPKVQTVVWTLPGILLPFSVVFFPLALLPTALQPISQLLPTTYIFESMRSVLSTGVVEWRYLAISYLLNILYLIGALYWFMRSFKKSLSLGLGRFN